MHVFGTQFGSAGMLSSISFFIYMRLGGVTYGASWLSWIGIFIKPHELCIRLLIILRSTFDLARTLNCFPFDGMIHILSTKLYMCSIHCRRSNCVFATQKCLGDFATCVWLSTKQFPAFDSVGFPVRKESRQKAQTDRQTYLPLGGRYKLN